MSDLTRILQSIQGDATKAAEELLPLVYEELRRLAAAKMAHEVPTTPSSPPRWCTRRGCAWAGTRSRTGKTVPISLPPASEAMRRILVESARRKLRLKRGGGAERVELLDDRTKYELRMVSVDPA